MTFFTFLIILIALLGILMTTVILMQAGKGGGLSGIGGGGGATTQILGARQAPDILEKATWTFGVIFIVLAILTNFAIPSEERGSVLQERAGETPLEQQQEPALPPMEGEEGGETEPAPLPPSEEENQ